MIPKGKARIDELDRQRANALLAFFLFTGAIISVLMFAWVFSLFK